MSFLFAGIITACIAAFAELFVASSSDIVFTARQTIVENVSLTPIGILLFATIEELLKFGLLMRITVATQERLSFPVRTGLFALGFGAIEIFLAKDMFPDAPTPAIVGIFLVHVATVFLYGFVIEKRSSKKLLLLGAVILGIAVHFAYNSLI
jgi:hypothetical protein